MRLAFTADLHISSAFACEDSAARNRDLLCVFSQIVDDARAQGADALLLGGDIFDRPYPPQEAVTAVRKIIADSGIRTYAIAGNHDPLGTVALYSDPPENLFVFGKDPECVDIGGVTLCGASVTDANDHRNIFSDVRLPQGAVLLCHGSLYDGSGHFISREAAERSGAALCLMGHIHKTAQYNWQGVRALYCGAPAGRGFDETGEHGYYLVDTDTKQFTYRKTDTKIYSEYTVDITGLCDIGSVADKLLSFSIGENEISRARLCGEITGDFYIDTDRLCEHTPFFEIKDDTVISDDILKNEGSDTLEGEFIRILRSRMENADEKQRQILADAIKEGITLLRSGR